MFGKIKFLKMGKPVDYPKYQYEAQGGKEDERQKELRQYFNDRWSYVNSLSEQEIKNLCTNSEE